VSDTIVEPASHSRLEHFPVTFFAVGMGMMGLTLALHAAGKAFGWPEIVAEAGLAASAFLLALVSVGYLLNELTPIRVQSWRSGIIPCVSPSSRRYRSPICCLPRP